MAYAITHAQYVAIRDDRSYSVVSFLNDVRCGTYSGLSALSALREILRVQRLRASGQDKNRKGKFEMIVVRNLPALAVFENDRAAYDKYLADEQNKIPTG